MNKDRTNDNAPKDRELSEKELSNVAGGYISPITAHADKCPSKETISYQRKQKGKKK